MWHGEDENEDGSSHPWRRGVHTALGLTLLLGVENSVALVQGAGVLMRGAFSAGAAGARAIASSSAAAMATATAAVGEASPAVIAGSAAGAVAVAGTAAVYIASQRSEEQARRLQSTIRNRERCLPVGQWSKSVEQLFRTLDWHLSPQKEGMPQVYHGSLWRSKNQEQHLSQLRELCVPCPTNHSMTPSERLWSDLLYCFSLWLEYNPHTANWGTCISYGSPPMHFCWHNRWREDLRHVVADLARSAHTAPEFSDLRSTKEYSCIICFLGMLDHVLSWEVTTLEHGFSELVRSDWRAYRSFCCNLRERFADAWAAAMAPPSAEILSQSFAAHVAAMAERSTPDGFCGLWLGTVV
jgi:hypothetical protein